MSATTEPEVTTAPVVEGMGITVEGVEKRFGTFEALKGVSVAFPNGSLTALLGPSGSGKSTLLRVIAALVLVRQRFHGKAVLNTIIDLPFAISPVVIGLALLLVYGRNGWIGQDLLDAGIQVIFSTPGMVLATIFVSLPFVVRETMPVLQEICAEQIVVMNDGRIEQVGTPRDLYESPANEFVMGFVGEVNRLGDDLVRPHDIQILLEPDGTTQEGQIERVAHLGFEVRVELVLDDGRRLAVQTTRQDAEERELETGQIVYLRPDRERRFAGA